MRNLYIERCFYFCFIKHGICRAVCFRGIFGCMQRFHFAGGYSCQTMNSYREIIPGTNSLIAEMVDTANNTFINNSIDGPCQVIGKSLADKLRGDLELIEGVYPEFDSESYLAYSSIGTVLLVSNSTL